MVIYAIYFYTNLSIFCILTAKKRSDAVFKRYTEAHFYVLSAAVIVSAVIVSASAAAAQNTSAAVIAAAKHKYHNNQNPDP